MGVERSINPLPSYCDLRQRNLDPRNGAHTHSVYTYWLAPIAMLPILPALILLLLQGPSNMERLARAGRLPAALDAIHRSVDGPEFSRSMQKQAVLASLLANHDAHLSSALFALLAPGEESSDAKKASPSEPKSIVLPGVAPAPCEGFARSARTRDGPFATA